MFACAAAPSGFLFIIFAFFWSARGGGPQSLVKQYGKSSRVTTLAPFGQHYLLGLNRRPEFAAGEAAIRGIAANAWRWASTSDGGPIANFQTDLTGFFTGTVREGHLQAKLVQEVEKAVAVGRGGRPASSSSLLSEHH